MSQLVLLAEKISSVREELAFALRRRGFQVIAVSDGLGLSDALELGSLSQGREPAPDIIVASADLDGYTGTQLCEQLSHDEPRIPFVLMGGKACAGASLLLDKPVSPETVVNAVTSCLLAHAFGQDAFEDEITAPDMISAAAAAGL